MVRVIEEHAGSPHLARKLESFVRQLRGGFGAHA